MQKVKKEIKTNNEYKRILGDEFKDENTSLELLKNIEYYTSNIINSFDKETFSKILNDETLLETISKSSKEIEKILNDFEVKFITISKNLNIEEFFSNNLGFDNLIKKNSRLDEESLNDWIEFLNLKSSFSELENKIIKLYDHNSLSYEKINNVFKAFIIIFY